MLLSLVAATMLAAGGRAGSDTVDVSDVNLSKTYDIRVADHPLARAYRARFPAATDTQSAARARLDRSGAVTTTVPELGTIETVTAKPGSGFLTPPSTDRSGALRGFLARHADAFGLSPDQIDHLRLFADYLNPAGNMAWVELEQVVNDLPVFRGSIRGGFSPRGELVRTTGQLAPGLIASALPRTAALDAPQAVARAAAHVGWSVRPDALRRLATDRAGRITLMRGSMAKDPRAWRLYFPLAPGVARLAWASEIWSESDAFLVLLDADDGTVLFRKPLTNHQTEATRFTHFSSANPAPLTPTTSVPGTNYQAPPTQFTWTTAVGNEPPNTFNNRGWIPDGTLASIGNAGQAGPDVAAPDGIEAAVSGTLVTTPFLIRSFYFTPDIATENPSTALYRNAEATNALYWVNQFHDVMYLAGFTELARNFQDDNFGRGALDQDRVNAETQDYAAVNTATFTTPADGFPGRLQLHMFTGPSPDRSSAFDTDTILHELTHGMSQRIHGNAAGLSTVMSAGMAEGWSDFFALTMRGGSVSQINGVYTYGAWISHQFTSGYTDNYYYGLRRFPYALLSTRGANGRAHNPLTFADIDPMQVDLSDGAYARGPIGSTNAFTPNNIGELWASALLEARARFVARLGLNTGNRRFAQFVVDGMKLDPMSPTLLEGRDALIAAATAGGTAADVQDVWAGFAVRGLGAGAIVHDASTGSVSENFLPGVDTPPGLLIDDVRVLEGDSGTHAASFTVRLTNASAAESRVRYYTEGSAGENAGAGFGNIELPDVGTALPYPATAVISGAAGTVQHVTAAMILNHPRPEDIDIVLVGPNGQKVMLMSDAGGSSPANAFVRFSDGGRPLTTSALSSGPHYAPGDLEPGESLPSPAPAAPYAGSLSVFNGISPNGTWRLYVQDDNASGQPTQFITAVSLSITTTAAPFVLTVGELIIPAGATSASIGVPINGNTTPGADQTFELRLYGPANAVVLDDRAVATIVDDDSRAAALTAPTPGSQLPVSQVFQWNAGVGMSEYWLQVGTTAGGTDIYNQSASGQMLATVSGIPRGVPIFVRLWSRGPYSGGWVYRDYQFAPALHNATMVSPSVDARFVSRVATFTWNPGSGVDEIWLGIGTDAAATNVYNASQGTGTSRIVTSLPINGERVWLRLWSRRGTTWTYEQYGYWAVDGRARLMLPGSTTSGATLPGTTVAFHWTSGVGASKTWLTIGTTAGGGDIYNVDQGALTERTLSGMPLNNGSPVYVRLWSLLGGTWRYNDYTFRGADSGMATLTSPANGSTLSGGSATLNWTVPAGVSQVWLYVGNGAGPGGTQILDTDKGLATSHVVTGLPTDGSNIYVRLWTLSGGTWRFIDYHFYASGGTRAALLIPGAGGTLPGSTATFRWTRGSGVGNRWLSIGTAPGLRNLYDAEQFSLTERTVTGLPTNGVPLYVRLWSRMGTNWLFTDYVTRAADANLATLTSPSDGGQLPGSATTFTWTLGSGTAQTWLSIGTSAGGGDLAYLDTALSTSYTATGLPIDARPIYVRLWSRVGTTWHWIDYRFTAWPWS